MSDSNLAEAQEENTVTTSKSVKRKVDDDGTSKKVKLSTNSQQLKVDTNISFEETDYYIENGLRKVYPYFFTYSTFCKGRWVGKHLLDVFAQEFHAYTRDQYYRSILSGTILVNGKKVDPEYTLKDNDSITNKVHRHEVGVIASAIKIIFESDDFVVVDKPPSIPVHPCGRYRHNCLLFILRREHNLKDLHTIHRLDRLTSGIMVLTKTLKKSQELDEQVRLRKLTKEYICRVDGEFPDGVVTCEESILLLSPKLGICIVDPLGKQSFTSFEKMSYNGKSSVVKCMPKTGRMHQIRVHLQYLGYPIVNDPIYNSEAFGPLKGKDGLIGKTKEKLIEDLMQIHNLEKWLSIDESKSKTSDLTSYENSTLLKILNHNLCMEEYQKLEYRYKVDSSKIILDPNCDFCKRQYRDPEPVDLMLFLHAYRYRGESWDFQTEMPIWANENWLEM